MTIRVTLSESTSLKDKRSVIRGIVDKLGRLKNVAIAETGLRDSLASAELTIAVVGDSPTFVDEAMENIINDIDSADELTISVLRVERY
jgi:hypothetical protein